MNVIIILFLSPLKTSKLCLMVETKIIILSDVVLNVGKKL